MAKIDRFSLIKATFNRQKTEKVPYALWKHFPEADKTSEGLAKAQLDFQQRFDSDLMKISPHGSYCVVDFGGILGDYRPVSGSRICDKPPISSLSDWETLEPVDPNDGEFGAQVKAVNLIHIQVENEIPTMMTIFSPFMVASKLDPSLLDHIFQDQQLLSDQITMLSKVMGDFASSVLDAGSDGLFIATQHFNSTLPQDRLQDFEFQPIKSILNQVTKKSSFNVLHLHGEEPYFKIATQLPSVHAINWHDQQTPPSLLEARQEFSDGLLGGLDEMTVLRQNDQNKIKQSINKVYGQFNSRGLVFAPGCVLPLDVPENNLAVVVETIKSLIPV
ncbi:MAG: uroporphyrinogen decarboxylase family protein [Candidatus Thorarchaeota archaeon]